MKIEGVKPVEKSYPLKFSSCYGIYVYYKKKPLPGPKGGYRKDKWDYSLGSVGFEQKDGKFRSDIGKKFFSVKVGGPWHRLPREAVAVPSLEVSKAKLDDALSNLV
ncbi:hypothetical protein DUI87_24539 [Hirundo rustica rustica]|uniref:Uncharacterized protein n=1 Tax=Hirundo rustica rustica TaxID=333673 RepID=A0A3M0JDW2_HIRRU|nr:hypothetical protein DUI87_24539 [Hirundo rustica rustica]